MGYSTKNIYLARLTNGEHLYHDFHIIAGSFDEAFETIKSIEESVAYSGYTLDFLEKRELAYYLKTHL